MPSALDGFFRRTTFKYAVTALFKHPTAALQILQSNWTCLDICKSVCDLSTALHTYQIVRPKSHSINVKQVLDAQKSPLIERVLLNTHNVCFDKKNKRPGPEVIQLFSSSNQLSMKFILVINVKMPTIVGILTFISMMNTTSERLEARNFYICRYFSFYEQLKFCAQLS